MTFRSAESWLRERGFDPNETAAPAVSARTPTSLKEAARIALEQPAPPATEAEPESALGQRLDDAVAATVARIRRMVDRAPKSERRIQDRLRSQDVPDIVALRALERCRATGVVDDESLARALVGEWRRKGRGPARIRPDLQTRGFAPELIERCLEDVLSADPYEAAFAVAMARVERLRSVDSEAAYRRLLSHLVRRGHSQSVSRKVARDALYADREARVSAER